MDQDQFDPRDPPLSGADNPLTAYRQPPAGLSALAAGQVAIAVLTVMAVSRAEHAGWTPLTWTVNLATIALLCASALGIWRRRWWGWWLTSAIYYAVFFNIPAEVVLWTTRDRPFHPASTLIVFVLAVFVLAYLNRQETLRFFRFPGADGRAGRPTILSPVAAGAIWAGIGLLAGLLKDAHQASS